MTKIEWVRGADGSPGLSWNALRAERTDAKGKTRSAHHCETVNEACRFCYANRGNARLGGLPFKPGHRKDYTFTIDRRKLAAVLRRKKPTRIFVESMSDAFGEWWPREFVDQIYAVMALCPQHTFINLSKRPGRRRQYLADPETPKRIAAAARTIGDEELGTYRFIDPGMDWPLPNVIEGVSVSNQAEAEEFVIILLETNAAARVVSAEPLLGEIDLAHLKWDRDPSDRREWWINALTGTFHSSAGDGGTFSKPLAWVIAGGESGSEARPMHYGWVRSLRDQCAGAGVVFFFKQWGEWVSPQQVPANDWVAHHTMVGDAYVMRVGKARAGRKLDGVEHNGFPEIKGAA